MAQRHIILYQPEIPPNTGNIIRLCANTGSPLHLIHPLGFDLEDKKMRRAGLDYSEWASVAHYESYAEFLSTHPNLPLFACTTKGKTNYSTCNYPEEAGLLFGPETRGLPNDILNQFEAEHLIRIPMRANSRSLNLSNAVAVILFEAWRQAEFRFGDD